MTLTVGDRELIELAQQRDDEMCHELSDRLQSLLSERDKLELRVRLDTVTVDAVLKAVENRSDPAMDATWSAGWNCALDFVSKAIIEARAALTQTEVVP